MANGSLVHIILCHNNPTQVERLVNKLLAEENDLVIIHVCKNAAEDFFNGLQSSLGQSKRVHFCEREEGNWGEFGIVQGTINALKLGLNIMGTQEDFHFNLLSAQDYPIKPLTSFKRFLSERKGQDFLNVYNWYPKGHEEVEKDHPWQQSKHLQHLRLLHWYKRVGNSRIAIPRKYKESYRGSLVQRIGELLSSILGTRGNWQRIQEEIALFRLTPKLPFPRKPPPYQFYNGSQWWTISSESAMLVVDQYNTKYQDLTVHSRDSMLSDEFFFQTLLMNSTRKDHVVKNNLREIHFELDQSKSRHPKVFDIGDIELLLASPHFFARKIDPDSPLLNQLDHHV